MKSAFEKVKSFVCEFTKFLGGEFKGERSNMSIKEDPILGSDRTRIVVCIEIKSSEFISLR